MSDLQVKTTLWIVYGSSGEYSDRPEWNVAVVESEACAQAMVTMLSQQYRSIPRSWMNSRWEHEDEMRAIMTLDPQFEGDYTGTIYYYGSAPLLTQAEIIALADTPAVTSKEG